MARGGRRRRPRESCNEWAARGWSSSGMADLFEVLQGLFSIAALVTYMVETYSASEALCEMRDAKELGVSHNITLNSCALQTSPSDWTTVCCIDMSLSSFFLLDFIVHLIISDRPFRWLPALPRYLVTMDGLIDMLTILPVVLPADQFRHMYLLRIIRVMRALRVLKIFRVMDLLETENPALSALYPLFELLATILSILFIFTGVYQVCEEGPIIGPDELGRCEYAFKFHDSLYFVLITLSTIGYGDIR